MERAQLYRFRHGSPGLVAAPELLAGSSLIDSGNFLELDSLTSLAIRGHTTYNNDIFACNTAPLLTSLIPKLAAICAIGSGNNFSNQGLAPVDVLDKSGARAGRRASKRY
jgi:hypothetical protein